MGSLTLKPLCFIKFETTPFSQWADWWWMKFILVSGFKFQVSGFKMINNQSYVL